VTQFPYYTFVDRSKMYSVGSLFYAIYFFVSFPMFVRIEEDPEGRKWSLGEVRLVPVNHVECDWYVERFICV
jgi:cycloeucalenol cycloisomerase